MTVPEAREILKGRLIFGNPEHREAVDLIARVNAQHAGVGPRLVCTCCEMAKPLKVHRIGCYVCAECAAQLDAHLDSHEEKR